MKRIKVIFAWYDIWVGLFYDRKKKRLYIFLIPMIGIYIQFKIKKEQEESYPMFSRLSPHYCNLCGGPCSNENH
jgi:hypothetical protein